MVACKGLYFDQKKKEEKKQEWCLDSLEKTGLNRVAIKQIKLGLVKLIPLVKFFV